MNEEIVIDVMEYYSVLKKKETLSFAMNLEDIILS